MPVMPPVIEYCISGKKTTHECTYKNLLFTHQTIQEKTFGINLDMGTSIIAAITIGIGVDDTIHFLNTYKFFINQGYSMDETIEKTLAVSGKAILFTSFALVFGFGNILLFPLI